jgi:hypothetical protein
MQFHLYVASQCELRQTERTEEIEKWKERERKEGTKNIKQRKDKQTGTRKGHGNKKRKTKPMENGTKYQDAKQYL